MRFAIITHVTHKFHDDQYFAYGPYVREMNVWGEFVDTIEIVGPSANQIPDPIDLAYQNPNVLLSEIPAVDLLGSRSIVMALLSFPIIAFRIFRAMAKADHIHLRCPGNIGLIGCLVQILFPSKPKTAKYAGNWDPESPQPWSYRLQKWILGNTFLTRNMKVLVYGEWPGSSKNIVPFFTATYRESDKEKLSPRTFENGIRFLFAGSLASGKRPMYAVRLIENLKNSGYDVSLDFFGEGKLRDELERYISDKHLSEFIILKGNRPEQEIRKAYKQSHFLILPSKSEGWPKVVAEAMFWSAVPLCTPISCVSWMLGKGERGALLSLDPENDQQILKKLIDDRLRFEKMALSAREWSQQYTLDLFRIEIKKLLQDVR